MKNYVGSIVFLFAFNLTFLSAKDFWEKPFPEWKRDEAIKMLTKSPWAEQHVFSRNLMQGFGSGVGGAREMFDAYTVRFFTALPIREAYVRMLQLNHNYDQLTPEQRERFDADTSGFLSAQNPDIIVALDFSSTDPPVDMDVKRKLQNLRTGQLQGLAYLSTKSAGQVPLKQYFPPSQDGTGAKFAFPRTIDGKPVITPEDREVTFLFDVPDSDHRVFIKWDVRKMTYQGELAF